LAEESDQGERTEAATARRLAQAAEAGQVPLSREVAQFAGLAAASLVLMAAAPELARALLIRLRPLLERPEQIAWQAAIEAMARAFALATLPFVAAIAAGGTVATLLQTGLRLNHAALLPDLGRINPARGLARLLGTDHLSESAKSWAKAAILGLGAWHVMSAELPALLAAPFWTQTALLERMLRVVLRLLVWLLVAQSLIAVLDLLWVRHRHGQRLRMSREEIKQETREAEGDPRIKARLRQIRLLRMRRRMMAAVPKATLVVTNPTHYAVALVYRHGEAGAPRVVAKGVDEVAARIRELARESNVPLVANPPLARALYEVPLDAEIPAAQFQAVAELIAYVWRLQARARPA
jgi:flagellar biosynthesis protein FlhB